MRFLLFFIPILFCSQSIAENINPLKFPSLRGLSIIKKCDELVEIYKNDSLKFYSKIHPKEIESIKLAYQCKSSDFNKITSSRSFIENGFSHTIPHSKNDITTIDYSSDGSVLSISNNIIYENNGPSIETLMNFLYKKYGQPNTLHDEVYTEIGRAFSKKNNRKSNEFIDIAWTDSKTSWIGTLHYQEFTYPCLNLQDNKKIECFREKTREFDDLAYHLKGNVLKSFITFEGTSITRIGMYLSNENLISKIRMKYDDNDKKQKELEDMKKIPNY